jgi:hypothetical protein
MEHRLDPLGDLDVKRVLAFARAREQYPAVPSGLLLDYCQAAWQAAVAGGSGQDVIERFERALVLIAWTHRRAPHLTFRSLVDQVIPQVALRPFMAPQDAAPVEEPEPIVEQEPPVRPHGVRPPARRLIPRVPFASPIPLGAAVAAGFVGVTALGQAGALPVAPLSPAGNDDAKVPAHGDGDAPAAPNRAAASNRPAAAADPGPSLVELAQLPDPPAEPTAAPTPKAPAPKPAQLAAAAPAPPAAEAPPPAPIPAPAVVQTPPPVPDAVQEVPDAADEAGNWTRHEVDTVEAPAPGHEEPSATEDPAAPEAPVDLQAGQGGDENGATQEDAGSRGHHAGVGDHFEPVDLSQAQPPPQPAAPPPPVPQPPAPAQVGPPPAPLG